jgi:hypothetical protein
MGERILIVRTIKKHRNIDCGQNAGLLNVEPRAHRIITLFYVYRVEYTAHREALCVTSVDLSAVKTICPVMYKCKYSERGAALIMIAAAITKFRENKLMTHAERQLAYLFGYENRSNILPDDMTSHPGR